MLFLYGMFINFNQTKAKLVPTSEYTLKEHGSKQVSIISMEDEREMTILLVCSFSGTLLPPQLCVCIIKKYIKIKDEA